MSNKVLVVEDETKLAELLRDFLERSGFLVKLVADGNEVMDEINAFRPDVLLLDIMLPNKDGVSLCKEIRQSSIHQYLPIIMLTAKVDEIDLLLGLEIGADDYVCKPYSPREVVARTKALIRRQNYCEDENQSMGLCLDNDKMQAYINGKRLDLTAIEYKLLSLMSQSPGRIYSRSQLMSEMYSDYRVVSERTIDSHIKKLRHKIADVSSNTEIIHSVYGVGYKMEYLELD